MDSGSLSEERTELPKSLTEADGSAVIRVLSYNIRSMRDSPVALARVMKACAPDLVLIQEAPRFFRWRKQLARLARAADLVILSGAAAPQGPRCSARCAPPSSAPRTYCFRSRRDCTGAASRLPSCGSGTRGSVSSAAI